MMTKWCSFSNCTYLFLADQKSLLFLLLNLQCFIFSLSGGELFERITADGYVMSEAEVINYMRQICEGIKHMHERNIIHLDVKPENIMCQTRKSTNIKLIDFGLATKLDPNEVVKISTGTAEFAAPEIVEREPVGFYTDMWAVGVLSYVL